ncbi:hypothetical protein HPB50_010324 [Hyalomma asiaticum]|uniref:Uncharacterized protein n=1 Tax=Hyalomma asiaticum TaxID=266040 RepID=A0ACB7RU16_HYAAI|nr:hypothetical protein HPB50_010324 [Hyalomma asiaticum]
MFVFKTAETCRSSLQHLAIYYSVKYFGCVLEGCTFRLLIDHKPLAFVVKSSSSYLEEVPQCSFLSEFSTLIHHIWENENQATDAFSHNEAVPASTGSTSTDFEALCNAQRDVPELTEMRHCPSSLFVWDTLLPCATTTLTCDTSQKAPRAFVLPPFQRALLYNLHGVSHSEIRATHTHHGFLCVARN